MAEKRKPKYTLLLRKEGKSKANKIEMFPASLWDLSYKMRDLQRRDHFRLRVDGKWWPEGKMIFFTKTEVKELVFRAMNSDT